ncbi:N-acetyldiaminopimelate deacetylase [Lactobacillus sp. PV037]|uniref:N-acetyldiaminopimelate deacetylase n=1 Tax=unclassified Lactobacillus TaxID=2620435 RepID=UPI00223FBE97|nr:MULTISPECIES: N-acetyldiaminopimelate deacetylase [unclassified Lactobacillus]QNQ82061.1 N-acetyldiaminopimelate deacetylase [Lactobacillus sp. PV012]QNQ83904.1 N-acetyldiaminopimelate deacetylase [Lactobacillus sp. PV037]
MSILTENELISIRRKLHQIPELALKEFKTQALLIEEIRKLNQEYLEIMVPESLPTAILVKVKGKAPRKNIGYRADMDALPVTEQTNLPYSSKTPNVMHACGHDIHMTVALGILSYFSENQPQDNLIFFFQPAEESESGAKRAYEAGIFTNNFQVDEFYGLHDNPNLPAGAIGCRMGTLFAGTTEVDIKIKGKSGHAAFPQDANDAVVTAASLIMQVQTIISRSIDPIKSGVVTFGKVEAGTIRNVIAGQAKIYGTIRGLTQAMIVKIRQRIKEICKGIELSFGVKIDLKFNQGGYWPVENNPELTQQFITYMKKNPEVEFIETKPAMTGEDFGFLLNKIPGTMFWLGVEDDSELHSATFNPQEKSILKGVRAVVGFLKERME